MSNLTYIPPIPPSRPFKVGDVVEVMSRNHDVLSTQTIAQVLEGPGTVCTKDGRTWALDGRARDGQQGATYPFPWIRLTESPR